MLVSMQQAVVDHQLDLRKKLAASRGLSTPEPTLHLGTCSQLRCGSVNWSISWKSWYNNISWKSWYNNPSLFRGLQECNFPTPQSHSLPIAWRWVYVSKSVWTIPLRSRDDQKTGQTHSPQDYDFYNYNFLAFFAFSHLIALCFFTSSAMRLKCKCAHAQDIDYSPDEKLVYSASCFRDFVHYFLITHTSSGPGLTTLFPLCSIAIIIIVSYCFCARFDDWEKHYRNLIITVVKVTRPAKVVKGKKKKVSSFACRAQTLLSESYM